MSKVFCFLLLFFISSCSYGFKVPEGAVLNSRTDLREFVNYLRSIKSNNLSPLYYSSPYWSKEDFLINDVSLTSQLIDCPAYKCLIISAGHFGSQGRRGFSYQWLVTVDNLLNIIDAKLVYVYVPFRESQVDFPAVNNNFMWRDSYPGGGHQLTSFCVLYTSFYSNLYSIKDFEIADNTLLDATWLMKVDSTGFILEYKTSRDICENYSFYYRGFDAFIAFIKTPRDHSRFNSEEYWKGFFFLEPLSVVNLVKYNNIAYYLSEGGYHIGAAFILNEVLNQFPNRTVAYVNLGDTYWGLEKHAEAREAYQTYIRLMRESNREQRIPQRVFERIGE